MASNKNNIQYYRQHNHSNVKNYKKNKYQFKHFYNYLYLFMIFYLSFWGYFYYKDYKDIKTFIFTNAEISNNLKNIKGILNDNIDKYKMLLTIKKDYYSVEKVDISVGRVDPFVPIITSNTQKKETILLKFLRELKVKMIEYFAENGKYPINENNQIDFASINFNVKDVNLYSYKYFLDNSNPLGIKVLDSQDNEVKIKIYDINKFILSNINTSNLIFLKYDNEIIAINLGEEFLNIKLIEIGSDYIVLQDTLTGQNRKIAKTK